ncbi:MAG: Holliday junction branch migration protein RuvA [Terriglobales bacterium]
MEGDGKVQFNSRDRGELAGCARWTAEGGCHYAGCSCANYRTIRSMIAHLRGTLLAKHPNQAIVETHGVGYDVAISVPTFTEMPAAGAEVALHIHTHVREDAFSLYGFLRLAEKQLFEKLLTVSGIGPTRAIKILSGMPADEMMGAIRGGDLARLTRIPGIGKKTAERMVLELRDKLPAATGASEASASPASPVEEDVISALINLGYQRAAADKALLAARGGKSPQSFEVLFREALGALSEVTPSRGYPRPVGPH